MMTAVIGVAVSLLPVVLHDRFREEWTAEMQVVRATEGRRAAVSFVGSLIPAAVRTTMEVRKGGETAYSEMSIAALCGLPPVLFLLWFGAFHDVWILFLGQSFSLIGILLVAHGFWRTEGRLLDSMGSRVGIFCTIVGATSGQILVDNVPELAPINPDEVISSVIPNAIIPIGFVLLVVANYTGRLRRRLQLAALILLAPGAAASGVVAVVNAASNGGISAFVSLLYGVPILGLAWASYVIAGRPKVFAENDLVTEL